jgi:fatty acid desaturase
MVANPQDMTVNVLGFVVTGFGGALLALMYLRYRVIAFRALWSHRSLGDARFENTVTPGRIIGITILGNIAVGVITAIVGAAVAVLLMIFGGQIFDFAAISAALESPDEADIATVAPALIVAAAGYLMVISLAFALAQALVTLPILGAQVRAMTIHNPRALEASLQREADRAVEAGGFADAVDVGAGL